MCIDYRDLNAITVKNREPLPRIDDLLDRVQGCRYFSKIDLKSGYHQIAIRPEDQHKTAFQTRYGLFEFVVMSFGLCNAPGTFQHAMNQIFHDYLDKFVIVYLDDILIFSKTVEEHVAHLDKVLSLLRQHKFKINGEKCEFGRTRVLYLGHEISAEGLKPDDVKVASIRDWPRPQSVTEMRSFLGMTGYYRNFVKNYSIVDAPLTDLTRLDTPWEWPDRCEAAFRHLKHASTHHEVLKLPDLNKSFIVTTDASQYGIGAVLAQQEGKKLRSVEYMSKKMPSQKLAKSTYKKELYAIYKALTPWRHYLLGRFFYVRTDHQTLKWMRIQPVLPDALKRWIEVTEQYDFEPQYIKGEYNKVINALSHRPDFFGVLITEFRLADDVTHCMVEAYREDQFMSEIIHRLEAKDKITSVEFELVNGLLFLEKEGNKRFSGGHIVNDQRKKTAQALARLWEKIMREIGVHRINVICTDNAEVNKKAAQILERHTDKDIARIPWVPCAAHCNLLLQDVNKLERVKSTVKRGHTIVKFIRNHHRTHRLMMSFDDSLLLLRPTEVWFGLVYMMLERLQNRRAVLSDMVDRKNAARWTGMRWSNAKLKSKADLVYFTLRRDGWWTELKKVVDVMEPLYNLLRRMDRDGTVPTNLIEYEDLIERKLCRDLSGVIGKGQTTLRFWVAGTSSTRSPRRTGPRERTRRCGNPMRRLIARSSQRPSGHDEDDGSILRGPEEEAEKADEELVRQSSFVKTPKGRIPNKLEDDEDECTHDESDLDDELWKGKCELSDESSAAEEEEDESDSDFELRVEPVPVDEDEAEADRAKALADRDRDAVQKWIMEEDVPHAAIPTRREIERHKKKVGKNEPGTRRPLDVVQEREEGQQQQSEAVVKVMEVALQEEENDKVQPKGGRAARGRAPQRGGGEEPARRQGRHGAAKRGGGGTRRRGRGDEEGMERQGQQEDMEKQEEAEGMDQQDMQRNVDEEDDEEEHQPAVKTVYTCRQRPVVSTQSAEYTPDFPPNNEAVPHDNLWVSRMGRKRKEPMDAAAAKPKRGRGRPCKPKTGEPVAKPKKKSRQRKARAEVVEDDPELDNCSRQSSEFEGCHSDLRMRSPYEEGEECTDDSDLDDKVWKGKIPGSEASSEEEVDESSDNDFELGIPPSIPCTTYVERREAAQRRRERPPTTPSQCTTNTTAHYNIQSDVELPQTGTDMEMVLCPGPINTDEEADDRAKAWADGNQERVQRRIEGGGRATCSHTNPQRIGETKEEGWRMRIRASGGYEPARGGERRGDGPARGQGRTRDGPASAGRRKDGGARGGRRRGWHGAARGGDGGHGTARRGAGRERGASAGKDGEQRGGAAAACTDGRVQASWVTGEFPRLPSQQSGSPILQPVGQQGWEEEEGAP
ncbi:hypothetical protein CBR_g19429 [Chara braunii]|uniref:Reverse transcriptase domain-containing protein n=1 Tax=Chara braunii TaxID=69332 RepID=A0A388KXY6_CHABU|nr:hypothetical protein CBR_g19429 [Chara braunii]|eukprot:GBG74915.1 hypothetical protein CBR_g19429 [Chara braunii]